MALEFEMPLDRILENVRRFYSGMVIDHAMNPRNVGELPEADGYACEIGDCGDRFEIWLRVRDGTIEEARFWTDGCAAQIACGSIVTELISGKPIEEALLLTPHQIVEALGGLPEENVHCAHRAVTVVKRAITDYLDAEREPWKRAYRKR